MNAKYTPGPWRTGGYLNPGTVNECQNIWSNPEPGMQSGEIIASKVKPANARRIITAVNCHDDLLEACKELLPEGWDDGVMDHVPGVRKARLAIAKAEGRS